MIGRLKNECRTLYKLFSKSMAYQNLKKLPLLRKAKLKFGKMIWKVKPYNYELHGDHISIETIKILIEEGKIDKIVETGTFRGFTTKLLAEMFPKIKIYTCEINEFNYNKAKRYLAKYSNVKVFHDTSTKFLDYLIKNKLIGDKTLFYLDAHWLDEWPLEEELKIITKNLKSSIIMVDDFKVPNDNRFVYDKYNGKECSLDMVIPNVSKKSKYQVLFPNYGEEIFSKNVSHPELVGYILILHNLEKIGGYILKNKHIDKFYLNYTKEFDKLLKKNIR